MKDLSDFLGRGGDKFYSRYFKRTFQNKFKNIFLFAYDSNIKK